MNQKAEQQRRLLAGLAVVLGLALAWRLLPVFQGPSSAADRAREEQQALLDDKVVGLDLAHLERPPSSYSPGRNIFRFGRKPAPPPPPPKPPPPPPRKAGAPAPPPPPPKARPPQFRLPLLGIFGPVHRRIAVFKDGEDILNVLRGERIQDKFIVHGINYETVDIAFVGFPDEKPQRVSIGQ